METENLRFVFCCVFFCCFGLATAVFVGNLIEYRSNKLQATILYAIMVLTSLGIAGLITAAAFEVSKIF
jgi:hypothetical protein